MLNNIRTIRIICAENQRCINVKQKLESMISTKKNLKIVQDEIANLTIAIGGDGTFIKACRDTNYCSNTIYIGINAGHLGFLQDLNHTDISIFLNYISSENQINTKQVFIEEIEVLLNDGKIIKQNALNEIIIGGKDYSKIDFKEYINGEELQNVSATAVFIATTTGDTGYIKSLGAEIDFTDSKDLTACLFAPITNSINKKVITNPLRCKNVEIEFLGCRNNVEIIVDGIPIAMDSKNVKKVNVKISDSVINKLKIFNTSKVETARKKLIQ